MFDEGSGQAFPWLRLHGQNAASTATTEGAHLSNAQEIGKPALRPVTAFKNPSTSRPQSAGGRPKGACHVHMARRPAHLVAGELPLQSKNLRKSRKEGLSCPIARGARHQHQGMHPSRTQVPRKRMLLGRVPAPHVIAPFVAVRAAACFAHLARGVQVSPRGQQARASLVWKKDKR